MTPRAYWLYWLAMGIAFLCAEYFVIKLAVIAALRELEK